MKQITGCMSLLVIATAMACAQSGGPLLGPAGAGVAGVVRDARGVPQMGVLVELLGAQLSATTLTDLQGRYHLDVRPGIYQLRASATLYLPALRRRLLLRAGMKPTVDLTMSGLLEESTWLPVRQQTVGESAEDWKWTLKSPVNRPMLRLVDGDTGSEMLEERPRAGESHARLSLAAATGVFGRSGTVGEVAVAHRSADGKVQSIVRSAVGSPGSANPAVPLMVSGLVESGAGSSMQRRAAGRIRTFPQIRDAEGNSLSEIEFSTAERMNLGDMIALEAGSETQILRSGSVSTKIHPFFRAAVRTGAGWTAIYTMSTSPLVSEYEDVNGGDSETPTFVDGTKAARTEAGVHQEIRLQRSVGRAKVQGAYHHDIQRRTAVAGLLMVAKGANGDSALSPGVMTISRDERNGTFRTMGSGYVADGCGLWTEIPVGSAFTVSGGYVNSVGLTVTRSAGATPGRLASRRSQAFLVAVQGRLPKTGTRLSTAYRWQPSSVVSTLASYDGGQGTPYLSVHLRQNLPRSAFLPAGAEVTVDGVNLAAQGYQRATMVAPDALLASALRELRAGITFTF